MEWEPSVCFAATEDGDRDGLDDRCELSLARAFAPALMVAPGGCDWDDGVSPARLGGGYYFGVQPVSDTGDIRIAYLPAYYRDCGWGGLKCWLPYVDCSPHAGDSEAIFVDVASTSDGRWQTRALFLSAHCWGSGSSPMNKTSAVAATPRGPREGASTAHTRGGAAVPPSRRRWSVSGTWTDDSRDGRPPLPKTA